MFKLPKEIAIYGLGYYGTSCIDYIIKNYTTKISFIIDNNLCSEQDFFNGIPIISYNEFLKINRKLFILVTIRSGNSYKLDNFENAELNYIHFDQLFVLENSKTINKVAKLFNDDESKILYSCLLGKRASFIGKIEHSLISANQYFCLPDFQRCSNQLLIDCGAYVGDTFEKWLIINEGNIGGYLGIDPFSQHEKLFKNKLSRLSSEYILNKKNINYMVGFVCNSNISVKLNNDIKVKSRTSLSKNTTNLDEVKSNIVKTFKLDDLLNNFLANYSSIFIKMDIEGSEFEALLGAENFIKEYNPLMAISVYHRIDDLIRIPLLINSFSNNYNFYLRHHSPTLDETILYCVPR